MYCEHILETIAQCIYNTKQLYNKSWSSPVIKHINNDSSDEYAFDILSLFIMFYSTIHCHKIAQKTSTARDRLYSNLIDIIIFLHMH